MQVNEILKMDGRKRAPYIDPFPVIRVQSQPNISSIKTTIAVFERTGSTNHSSNRLLLPYVIAYCEENNIPYQLSFAVSKEGKRAGYFIKKLERF